MWSEHLTHDLPLSHFYVQYNIINHRLSVLQQISRTYSVCIIEIFYPQAMVTHAISSSFRRVLALSQKINSTPVAYSPVLCHHALARGHFPDRKGLRFLNMTDRHMVGIAGLGVLGEKNITYVHIQTYLAGRKTILSPLKVTGISENSTDLVTKGHGPRSQREFIKWHILHTKLEVASGWQSYIATTWKTHENKMKSLPLSDLSLPSHSLAGRKKKVNFHYLSLCIIKLAWGIASTHSMKTYFLDQSNLIPSKFECGPCLVRFWPLSQEKVTAGRSEEVSGWIADFHIMTYRAPQTLCE